MDLKRYISERNIDNDYLIDKINNFCNYFKLYQLSDDSIRKLLIDIAVEFGEGYLSKILRFLAKRRRTEFNIEAPDFKEDYGIHYLNTVDYGLQFVYIIYALFETIDPKVLNFNKLKKIISLFYTDVIIQKTSKKIKDKVSHKIINYV